MKKRKKLFFLAIIIVIFVVSSYYYIENRGSEIKREIIIAPVVEYYDLNGETVVVLYEEDIAFCKHFVITNNTKFLDKEISHIIENKIVGETIYVSSIYELKSVYNKNGPPWIFPATYIGVHK